MNSYYYQSLQFQEALREYAEQIFCMYGKELVLRLEEYNLLQNKHNCIESSTALGFVIEEFLSSKLEMYTHLFEKAQYKIERIQGGTTQESYDCYSIKDGIKYLVNIKSMKAGSSSNDAVAAIGQLYHNYVEEDPRLKKNFVILRVKYSIRERDEKPRHIYIETVESYCLEEVDFRVEHQQDNRSWSAKGSSNNGRLKASNTFRKTHKVNEKDISYDLTREMLTDMFTHKK